MKYSPKYSEHCFVPIATANKNTTSYFMRSDITSYVPDKYKYPKYTGKYRPLRTIIDNGCLFIEDIRIETDLFHNSRYNVEKYQNVSVCKDKLYQQICEALTQLKPLSEEDLADESASEEEPSGKEEQSCINEAEDKKIKTNDCGNDSKNRFVQLIFSDFFCRSDLISLVDIFVTKLCYRGIMLLPMSLSISLGLSKNNSIYIYENGFSFIDDFMLADAYEYKQMEEQYPETTIDDEDFVEEFSRMRVLDDSHRFSCMICEYKEDSKEKIETHLLKEHKEKMKASDAGNESLIIKGETEKEAQQQAENPVTENNLSEHYYVFERGSTFTEAFENRKKYLFSKEKLEKLSENIYSVKGDCEGAEKLENYYETAMLGASLISQLECAADLWMTDVEWTRVRLRALKEKLLFFI
ncbi:hypothetical protein ENBRE01_1797 [Enteropsectra breve]|nr:hypothetical protein ENBRE01_1797 [Enteropsectra breve]